MYSGMQFLSESIRKLVAKIDAKPDMLFATVESRSGNELMITIDGDTEATPCFADTKAQAGERVCVLRKGTTIVAIARAGGD